MHEVRSQLVEADGVDEGLAENVVAGYLGTLRGYRSMGKPARLQRELGVDVAEGHPLAVHGADGAGPRVRRRSGQLGNVRSYLKGRGKTWRIVGHRQGGLVHISKVTSNL